MDVRDKLKKLRDRFCVDENLTLGLDIGIASCGWALLNTASEQILAAGTWGFETPEVPKTRASKAAERRVFRGQRRRLRRRAGRMRDIRQLLHRHGLLTSSKPPVHKKDQPETLFDPWKMRAEGLKRKLGGEEFATALIHIAKHRGYRSNSKSEGAQNAPSEDKKALSGLASILEKSARWQTVGEMFALDPEFADKKRNRAGDYSHTVFRSLHEAEITELFKSQRGFGSPFAAQELESVYTKTAFDQLPLQDSEQMLGTCPFELGEKRASALSYSFEKFRFLSKLVHSRVSDNSRSGRNLTREELSKAVNGFGKGSKKVSWKTLINLTGLPKDTRFIGVGEKAMGNDLARASKRCAYGANTLYKVLGEAAWNSLVNTPKKLDAIAHVLTFREDVGRIREGLEELELQPAILDALMAAVKTGAFAGFSKAGHISTRAARNIIPGLLVGKVYSEACELAGYDHTRENPAKLDAMTNPVAKRAVRETLKQVNAIVQMMELRPGAIHIELGRDVGKGPKERGQILAGITRRTDEKSKARDEFCDLLNRQDCSTGELMRFEMWKEQMHDCMFCYPHRRIEPEDLCDGRHAVEIEHVLPLGRSQDNSWNNKVLACTKCNREKRNQTPYEWFGDNHARWNEFEYRVVALRGEGKIKGFKIRNLLMRDFEERKSGFIERNLNDLRYAARVVQSELRSIWTPEESQQRRRMFARPGTVTGTLRWLWGLNRLKYLRDADGNKTRIEDERHHGVDAIVVAACDESTLNRLTRAMQDNEEKGVPPNKISDFPPPWETFRNDVLEAHKFAPVARSENRRARGAGHAATIRKIRVENGLRIAYERVAVDKMTHAKLDLVKDPDRNRDVIDALFDWIAVGKSASDPPCRQNGFEIKKVTLHAEKKPTTQRAGFEAHGGLVDNADMVRLDVFEKAKKFYLVPIYAHQVADREGWPVPPNRAINAHKPEEEWQLIDHSFSFQFSLCRFSWVEAVTGKGEVFEGYYRGTNRATGAFKISLEFSRAKEVDGIGARTLRSFKKFQMDRLGHKTEIKSEVRTWHGVACT